MKTAINFAGGLTLVTLLSALVVPGGPVWEVAASTLVALIVLRFLERQS